MNEFEKACSDVDDSLGMMTQENVIEWMKNAKVATITFSQPKYINKIRKLAEKFPDEVKIKAENKDCIVAHIPVSFIKINNPPKRTYSEEERAVMAERLRGYKNVNQKSTD